jgi:hypothetical protein
MDEEYRARVIQDGAVVAQAFGDRDSVIRHGQHYHAAYLVDGPADLVLHVKRGGRWRFVDMTPPAPPKLAPWEAAYEEWEQYEIVQSPGEAWQAAVEWCVGQANEEFLLPEIKQGFRRRIMGDDA